MRKPLRPHREGPTIVGGGSEVILTVLYDKRKRVTFWVTLMTNSGINELFPVIRWIYSQVLLYIATEIGG